MYDIELSGCFNDTVNMSMPFSKIPNLGGDRTEELILVLDPSSSQTGIVLGNCTGDIRLLMDFKNLVCDKQTYTGYLNDYLTRIIKYYRICQMVYEVTFDRSQGDQASVVLTNLENNFKRYSKIIPTLTKDDMFPILPSVWRKNFLKSKEYNGMRSSRAPLKEATRKECSKLYPQYQRYFFAFDKAPDSTDAIGIYHGFLEEYWWDQSKGIKRVSKVNSRYSKNHAYKQEIIAMPFEEVVKYAAIQYSSSDMDIFAFNSDLSVIDNVEIVTAQTSKPCIIFAMDKPSISLLRWSVTLGDASSDTSVCAIICKRIHDRR